MNGLKKSLTYALVGTTLLSAGPLLMGTVAHAAKRPRLAANAPLGVATLRVPLGRQVFLPLPDVKRIVPDDHEVARGYFRNGRAGLEGITAGTTYVQVFNSDNKRTMFAVRVEPGLNVATEAVLEPASAGTPGETIVAVKPVGETATITPITTEPVTNPSTENRGNEGSIVPAVAARSSLAISLRVTPVEDNPLEALFTIYFANRGTSAAQDAKVRFVLSDAITYVNNSATNGGQFDAMSRALTWNVGNLAANSDARSVSFRVAPVDRPQSFYAVATIEDASQVVVTSNTLTYGFTKSPLLTVFALPDRILAGKQSALINDVRDPETQMTIERLVRLGVLSAGGRGQGLFMPGADTIRAEYTVMTLNGLNLRDLRDVTAIKFVLAQKAKVRLSILNSLGKQVRELIKDKDLDAGEHMAVWNGTSPAGDVQPGRYTYVCTAKDAKGQATILRGYINVMPQRPLEPLGKPSFKDIKASDWYAGYLAIAQNQNLVKGKGDGTFRPLQPINRVEATAIIVRAMGLEDAALKMKNIDPGFLDYQNIPRWAVPYVNIATQLRTTEGKTLARGKPGNIFNPMANLRRDEAALLVHRMIDNNRVQKISISGEVATGATVTINNQTVMPDTDGKFSLVIEPDTSTASMAVIDKR
jgi:uncharacterized repeat protein (TIGR01451 family)